MKKDEEGNAGRVGWGEPREGVEGTERTRSGRRGPQAPQRLVIQNPYFSTTHNIKRDMRPSRIKYSCHTVQTLE
ncbi:hypothetical protein TNCV_4478671 [Trichonephila clavipes]|nr:hypothetical protein TNCV_4478671 [Trichonephila clavipes]